MHDMGTKTVDEARHAVVIAGGGPTGLMLASELALAGVDVAIVERRTSQQLDGLRAGGLHARTIEVLDQRGIAERFLAAGRRHPRVSFHVPLRFDDFPSRHNCVLALWQNHVERLLADWVLGELAVTIHRGCEVVGFTQDDGGVDVALSDGRSLRAGYLVGCDGGRSAVRKAAGIEFPGWEPTTSWLIAEGRMSEEPPWGYREDAVGTHAAGPLDDGRGVRVVVTEAQVGDTDEPTLDDVRAALVATYGTDYGLHGPAWISRFTDMTRQAAAYRDRRVLLAGDAAHVHPPMGGQGLNIGVQDAVNLGWKLAQVVKGVSPDALLDSYHAERHPAAARVLRNTLAQTALRRTDERTKALGEIVSELFAMDEPRRRLAGMVSGLDVHYDLGEGHPLLGRRIPDLDLAIAAPAGSGPTGLTPAFLSAPPNAGVRY
jgi:3-(3-hydroxy-phenyl)propionate hydroxylase